MEHIDIALTGLGYTYREVHAPISGLFCKATRLANTPASRSERAPQLSQRAAPPALCQGAEKHLPNIFLIPMRIGR